MNILPIKFLTSYDKSLFGENSVNLSYLSRLGFPVAFGYVVVPPEKFINKIKSYERFGSVQNLTENFKNSKDAAEIFDSFHEKRITKKVWNDILDKWYKALEREIETKGKLDLRNLPVKPQTVLFTKKIKACGSAYISIANCNVEIEIEKGKLSIEKFSELDELILKINKKLLLMYVYDWVLDEDGFKFTGIRPFTQDFIRSVRGEIRSWRSDTVSLDSNDVALKIFGSEEIDLREWIEVGTPEGIIKLSISEGKNFVINLDRINQHLTGTKDVKVDPFFLISFIENSLKKVIQDGGLVLAGGSLVLQDDILKFLIKIGVYGIIVDGEKSELNAHIKTLEHMNISKILN